MSNKKKILDLAKESIPEIVSISESCPEPYKVKCFEVLLEKVIEDSNFTLQPLPISSAMTPELTKTPTEGRRLTLPELRDKFKPEATYIDCTVLSAYWLEKYSGKVEGFSRQDLTNTIKSLRVSFANLSDCVSKVKDQGYLVEDKGLMLLSQKGLDYATAKLGAKQ